MMKKILLISGFCTLFFNSLLFAEEAKNSRNWRESLVDYISQDISNEMGINDIAVIDSVNATILFSEITAVIVYDCRGNRIAQKVTGNEEDRKNLISISIRDALTRVKKENRIIQYDFRNGSVPRIIFAAPLLTRSDKKYLGCLIVQFNMKREIILENKSIPE